jgi:hypothetical protein
MRLRVSPTNERGDGMKLAMGLAVGRRYIALWKHGERIQGSATFSSTKLFHAQSFRKCGKKDTKRQFVTQK